MRFALLALGIFCHSSAQILSVRWDGEVRWTFSGTSGFKSRLGNSRIFVPMHSLGYVLRVIVLLEGESSVQSNVPSADHYKDISALCLAALRFSPTWPVFHTCIWCLHHHVSLLEWDCTGDEKCLVSSRLRFIRPVENAVSHSLRAS